VEECVILGDVTFGACCVDDYSASALGAQFLVHYGHSCLVPVDVTSLPCLYVFVDIALDLEHLEGSVRLNFPPGAALVLAGTIQFASAVQAARARLAADYPALHVPKCAPLSPGEVLGCTAPVLAGAADAIVFVADGRFHLEAIMIANPSIPAYRYDPYARELTRERYDHVGMRAARRAAIAAAAAAPRWGLVLGTLGRQGNPRILDTVRAAVEARGREHVSVLLSEVTPPKLAALRHIDAFVQVACPRLSIDWGEGFDRPTLSPYEALVALGAVPGWWEGEGASGAAAGASGASGASGADADAEVARQPYPMDYYSRDGGVWSSSYHKKPPPRAARAAAAAAAAAAGGAPPLAAPV
jgi:2-(3-amino-3-carboxypropyl)histidine synthase